MAIERSRLVHRILVPRAADKDGLMRPVRRIGIALDATEVGVDLRLSLFVALGLFRLYTFKGHRPDSVRRCASRTVPGLRRRNADQDDVAAVL